MKIIFSALLLVAVLALVGLTSAQECATGQFKQEDCNNCRCINGLWACTRKACVQKRDVTVECLPGQNKKEDCNTCTCANNKWACTRKFCIPQIPQRPGLPPPVWQGECLEGSEKREDCNDCKCTNGAWGCTRNHCVHRRQLKCRPNSHYQKECNSCTCSADGYTEACTYRLCPGK